jgi:hypothetical protein
VSDGEVYAGGDFTNGGGNPNAIRIAKWNDSNWIALGNGLTNWVEAIAISGSNVYAGGYFTNAGGNANANHIAFYYTPTQTFRSQAAYDGWVLESSQNSGAGGTMDAISIYLKIGADDVNRQYRDILSFDTSALPDNAVIDRVTLYIKKIRVVGSNPFYSLGGIAVDICTGAFGGNNALQLNDFQAASSKNAVGIIQNNPVSGWYSTKLNSSAFAYINLAGVTQFRLRFQTDDNNEIGYKYIKFYSGNGTTASYRPQLVVEYYVP